MPLIYHVRTKKEELIIVLRKEGKTWDEIADYAKVSPNTISKVLDDYEQSEAFNLFQENLTPVQVRIKLSMSPEKVEKHYLAFRKLHDLFELSSVCYELGQHIPDFLSFYMNAKLFNITPDNMNNALDLAKNIEFLKGNNNKEQAKLIENRKANAQEATNLAEVRSQRINAYDHLSKMKNELKLLKEGVEKIKNTSDYHRLEDMIFDVVNSISSDKYYLCGAALIAVMRMIQKDPTLISFIQFPFPDKIDLTAHTPFHQYVLIKLINMAMKFMPIVLEELAKLVGNRILPDLQNLDLLIESNSELPNQQNSENCPTYKAKDQRVSKSKEYSDHCGFVTTQQSRMRGKSITLELQPVLTFQQSIWEELDAYYEKYLSLVQNHS